MAFVHLHTHSEYSLLDGANRIPDLLERVQALGMDSLAITDHGNLHGAWQFYAEARARKVRPILGFEAYLAFGPRQAREKVAGAPAAYSHLVLLAKNRAGPIGEAVPAYFIGNNGPDGCGPVGVSAAAIASRRRVHELKPYSRAVPGTEIGARTASTERGSAEPRTPGNQTAGEDE